jgi:Na+/H+ antiporter NhaD/arsenite permease-like protein
MAIDRVGIALLGAIAMVLFGVLSLEGAIAAIDWPTIFLLYSLMVLSAQLRLGGFYTKLADCILVSMSRPAFFLFLLMMVSAALSALLANDIICFAFTPVLAYALVKSGLNPLPFLLGLAVASNIGSAATIIGNPQNMLIGQMGRLDFGHFILWCGPPSLLSLFAGYGILLWFFRKRFYEKDGNASITDERFRPVYNPWQTSKGIVATVLLVCLFFTSLPREITAITIAGVLLCSRKMRTRDMLGLVDWHLITLFLALFVIIAGISRSGYLNSLMELSGTFGVTIHSLPVLTGLSAILSNMVSNVPAVMLLVGFLDPLVPEQWYALALSSTFAGNLFLLGSIANLIVVEQAAYFGITISFRQHAVVGVPITLVSLFIMIGWIIICGAM